jgi:hypothetical protein
MKAPTFGGKPSDTHVVWRDSGASEKRFDEAELRKWCSHYDVDLETSKRVDHDRADETRQQHRIVFAWTDSESESFSMGEDDWQITAQKTPRTFLEIDSKGEVRVKGWNSEQVLDVTELWWDGSSLVFEAAEFDDTKRLDARKLSSRPE